MEAQGAENEAVIQTRPPKLETWIEVFITVAEKQLKKVDLAIRQDYVSKETACLHKGTQIKKLKCSRQIKQKAHASRNQ
jgi:hypothetical protein